VRSSAKIVVVGASAGGVEGLRDLVRGLPDDLPSPVLVVLHMPPDRPSSLPEILDRSGPLPVCHPTDGEKLEAARIYVARPGHQLLVDGAFMTVRQSPKENRFSPSIDALFQSAAYHYRSNVIGVVLSGALDDGTQGLWSIKRFGGITIVQEPEDAQTNTMPLNALREVRVDYKLPAADIGGLLGSLTRLPEPVIGDPPFAGWTRREPAPPIEHSRSLASLFEGEELMRFTCDHCRPVLEKIQADESTRLHRPLVQLGEAPPLASVEHTDELMLHTMTTLEKSVMLLQHLSQHLDAAGKHGRAQACRRKQREAEDRAKRMRALLAASKRGEERTP
jgi:two-component system, chemotaxis family, protein-glutamate methylesterase/glutaminase